MSRGTEFQPGQRLKADPPKETAPKGEIPLEKVREKDQERFVRMIHEYSLHEREPRP